MKQEILRRVFNRLNKETVVEVIQRVNPSWSPSKKQRRVKKELLNDFLTLADIINDEDIEDFVEMAVMTKQIGLPAYTYKVNDLNFLEDHPIQNIKDYILLEKFSITVEEHSDLERSLNMVLRIKEYNERWRHGGVLDRNSLTAVYKINVELDKNKNKVTFNAGNDQINEVTKKFVTQALNWPIISYRILEKTNQSYQIGNASFKTAILLDFINNRLNPNGI